MDARPTAAVVDLWLARAEPLRTDHDPPRRRHQPRALTDDHFLIRPLQEDFPETSAKGLNISAGGLGLFCRRAIPCDYFVAVRLDEDEVDPTWVPASVIHCTQTLGGYKVGLRLRSQ